MPKKTGMEEAPPFIINASYEKLRRIDRCDYPEAHDL